MEPKKHNKLGKITATIKKQTHRYREQASGFQGEMGGRGSISVAEWEAQNIGHEAGSRIYCTVLGIEQMFCNDYKWKVSFKNYIKGF